MMKKGKRYIITRELRIRCAVVATQIHAGRAFALHQTHTPVVGEPHGRDVVFVRSGAGRVPPDQIVSAGRLQQSVHAQTRVLFGM